MNLSRAASILCVCASLFQLVACQTATNSLEQQTAALSLTQETLANRDAQSRRFDTDNETQILAACAGVLQDLGFTLDESDRSAGFIVASKSRDAIEADQVAGQLFVAALVAALGGRSDPVWDRDQKIRVSVVTKPHAGGTIIVRAKFQRVVWNTKNKVSKAETINDPVIYQKFFDKLSQSIFLEAHNV